MRHFSNALLFGLSFVLALVSCDAYLQLAEIQTPMETRIDSDLGPTYIPGTRISRFNEGFFLGEANAYGYMGPSTPPRRRNEERRILLLGDSFLLGHTVLPRHHFARTLEKLLSEATGATVEALNFGKADFDLQDMYLYYRNFAGIFDHDLALFFVDEKSLAPWRKGAPGLQPVVNLIAGRLVVDRSFRESKTFRFYRAIEPLLTRSAVLRLAFNANKMVSRGELLGVLFDKLAPPLTWALAGAGPRPLGNSASTVAARLPEINLAILGELRRDPRNILVVQKDLPPLLREEVRRVGLPILDLGTALRDLEARGEDPYYWPVTRVSGHWNHATHQVIARFLAQELARQRLLWPAAPSTTSPWSAQ